MTVTGQSDAVADRNRPYAVVFGATTSADPDYAAVTPANVPAPHRNPRPLDGPACGAASARLRGVLSDVLLWIRLPGARRTGGRRAGTRDRRKAREAGTGTAADQFADPRLVFSKNTLGCLPPPRLVAESAPQVGDGTIEWRWLQAHAEEYRGKWVAVAGEQLLAADEDLSSVVEALGERQRDAVLFRFD